MRLLKVKCSVCGKISDVDKKSKSEICACKKKFNTAKARALFAAEHLEAAGGPKGKAADIAEALKESQALRAEKDYIGAHALLNAALPASQGSAMLWLGFYRVSRDMFDLEQASEFFAKAEACASSSEEKDILSQEEFSIYGAEEFFAATCPDASPKPALGEDEDDEEKETEDDEYNEIYYYCYECRNYKPRESDRVIVYYGNRKDITAPKLDHGLFLYAFFIRNNVGKYEMTVCCEEFISSAPFSHKHFYARLIMPTTLETPAGDTVIEDGKYIGLDKIRDVVVSDGVVEIGDNAFAGCSALKSVRLPESLKLLGDNAFAGCAALESVIIPDSVTGIGSGAFSGCKSLKSVILPSKLFVLSPRMFENCEVLILDKLPAFLDVIGESAFAGCKSLESIVLPDTLTVIGTRAFSKCENLSTARLPAHLEDIGAFAFEYTAVRKITAAASGRSPLALDELGDGAFSNCKFLGEFRLGSAVKAGSKIFASSNVKLYIEFKGKIPPTWAKDWNSDSYGRFIPYYQKTLLGGYKLKK